MVKRVRLARALAAGVILLAGLGPAARPASARVFIGLGFGPYWYGPAYPLPYPYPYPYPYPPAYGPAYPPPYPPAAAPPAAGGAPAGAEAGPSVCRPFTATTTIENSRQQVAGTACRFPDGSWRMVR